LTSPEADAALRRLGEVIQRRPFAYASTWPIEEIDLVTPAGRLVVLLKTTAGPNEAFAYELLGGYDLGTPQLHAVGENWLLLERVEGVPLWQSGDLLSWQAVARWCARLHDLRAPVELSSHGAGLYEGWVTGALENEPLLNSLRAAAERAIARLLGLPRTLIHGELYPSNVVLAGNRIAVVDWEQAAAGPGVIDLGALVTGWDDAARRRLLAAYGAVEPADLAAAELVLALRWLGRTIDRRPPAAHRTDWLAVARAAEERLR
jgi:Ser/Thr protein kinase RdoA (MazF antagonist)